MIQIYQMNINNYETLCMNVNDELSKLNEWFSIGKLSLNVKKTNIYELLPEC